MMKYATLLESNTVNNDHLLLIMTTGVRYGTRYNTIYKLEEINV